jgi:hypothetical protein
MEKWGFSDICPRVTSFMSRNSKDGVWVLVNGVGPF